MSHSDQSSANQGAPGEEARRAIAARSREFELRFSACDAAGLVAAYFVEDTEQPIASPPGGVSPVRGRAALAKMFASQFDVFRAIRLEAVQIEVGGELAFELGRAHLTSRSGSIARGRYTVLWKVVGDEWRAKVDFFAQDGWED